MVRGKVTDVMSSADGLDLWPGHRYSTKDSLHRRLEPVLARVDQDPRYADSVGSGDIGDRIVVDHPDTSGISQLSRGS
jgi:hypothetical protein